MLWFIVFVVFMVRIALMSGFSFEIFAFCSSFVMWVTPRSLPIDNALMCIVCQPFKPIEPILRSLLGSLGQCGVTLHLVCN